MNVSQFNLDATFSVRKLGGITRDLFLALSEAKNSVCRGSCLSDVYSVLVLSVRDGPALLTWTKTKK